MVLKHQHQEWGKEDSKLQNQAVEHWEHYSEAVQHIFCFEKPG